MKKEFKLLYSILAVVVLAITTIGATYAYWTATTQSTNNAVQTGSTIFSISMDLEPLYDDFSIIPMNDEDALKALKNKCKDKYDRGACAAYTIYVYDYNDNLDFISGYMDVTLHSMINISYMMYRLSDTYEEDRCVKIEETNENYCIAKEPAPIGNGRGLSLGDSYDVAGTTDAKFILLIWLSNLDYSQNDIDIGAFEAIVTMQAGSGGEIKGSISKVIKNEDSVGDSNSETNTDKETNTNTETNTKEEQNSIENGE